MKNKKEKSHQSKCDLDDRKYHLDFEVIDLKEQKRPEKMVKIARKNLKKVILHRINGKIGEC
jgi:uncharacterized membrane protein YkoI